jgi:hypothetical protein
VQLANGFFVLCRYLVAWKMLWHRRGGRLSIMVMFNFVWVRG